MKKNSDTNDNSTSMYSTHDFLIKLRDKVESIVGHPIRQDVFSKTFLGQNKRHYEYVISKTKEDKNYELLENILKQYENRLNLRLGNKFESIKFLFEKYRNDKDLATRRFKIYKYHPNININYFKNIDYVEKAYWFGFLLADGSIFMNKGNKVISIEVNVKDGIIIKNFIHSIGYNPKNVEYLKFTYINGKGKRDVKRTFRVRFTNDEFADNLVSHGFIVGHKSDKIRFPSLVKGEYQLACLLGFFDGDGSHVGTPTIYSKSRAFLEDVIIIAEELGYAETKQFKIHEKKEKSKKTGKISKSFYLGLGGKFFNDMLDIYNNSLPRKRKRYLVGDALKKRRRQHWEKYLSSHRKKSKFKFSKKDLIDLRKNWSYKRIAQIHMEKFGITVSLDTVRYWCLKWNIKESNEDNKLG